MMFVRGRARCVLWCDPLWFVASKLFGHCTSHPSPASCSVFANVVDINKHPSRHHPLPYHCQAVVGPSQGYVVHTTTHLPLPYHFGESGRASLVGCVLCPVSGEQFSARELRPRLSLARFAAVRVDHEGACWPVPVLEVPSAHRQPSWCGKPSWGQSIQSCDHPSTRTDCASCEGIR